MPARFEGEVALVTGAAGGIGRAAAQLESRADRSWVPVVTDALFFIPSRNRGQAFELLEALIQCVEKGLRGSGLLLDPIHRLYRQVADPPHDVLPGLRTGIGVEFGAESLGQTGQTVWPFDAFEDIEQQSIRPCTPAC